MSSIFEAIAIPNAVNAIPINAIKRNAVKKPVIEGACNPMKRDTISINVPWIIEVVAPPSVWPSIISVLDMGATNVSLRNPNCLSHNICIPENTEENSIVIATIPGMTNPK